MEPAGPKFENDDSSMILVNENFIVDAEVVGDAKRKNEVITSRICVFILPISIPPINFTIFPWVLLGFVTCVTY